jgi:hypothetical protein
MTTYGQDESTAWPPQSAIFYARSWGSAPDDSTILLRHPSSPYITKVDLGSFDAIQAAATRYVVAAERAAGLHLPVAWLEALEKPQQELFGWLPIDPDPPGAAARPIASRYIQRLKLPDDRSQELPFRQKLALLLFATYRVGDSVFGAELGIRLIFVLEDEQEGGTIVRITGLSAAMPPVEEILAVAALSPEQTTALTDILPALRPAFANVMALKPDTVFIRGVRPRQLGVQIRARGIKLERQGELPYEFVAHTAPNQDGQVAINILAKAPLVANAIGPVRIVPSDPASQGGPASYRLRRPTRTNEQLEPFGVTQDEPDLLQRPDRVIVRQSRFVLEDDPTSAVPKGLAVLDANLPTRSNYQSAVATLRNLSELFDRMDRYGIDPDLYFRHAALPLLGFYRSGVSPGPGKDGRTINARVLPKGWDPGSIFPPTPLDRPSLEIHLALGDLTRRERSPFVANARPSQAVPLGIAVDTRFMWHELGHVLLMAALGQLEFNFAHSMGDALAAITADPKSLLSTNVAWRGNTFPWVFVPRRHDRSVLDGWGWAGIIGQELRQTPQLARLHLKGYWTEQILSTTLFLLYRSLGGEVSPIPAGHADTLRFLAADYVVYLIIAALELLGDPRVVPAFVAEQFAAALSEADELTVATVADDEAGRHILRIGGCATKVVRWAFEAQGMFPPTADGLYAAPGRPPEVDVYIPDRRKTVLAWGPSDVDYGPGAYVPVPLAWDDQHPDPDWLADRTAIQEVVGGLQVTVGNRGTVLARAVSVTLWLMDWPMGQIPPGPDWQRAVWQGVAHDQSIDIPPGDTRQFGPIPLPAAAGRRLVLVQANCADDRAIIDPILGLSCVGHQTALSQLVPGDNNLGLAMLGP